MMNPKTQTIVATTAIALTASIAIALIPTKPDASTAVLAILFAFPGAIAIIIAARFAYLRLSNTKPTPTQSV